MIILYDKGVPFVIFTLLCKTTILLPVEESIDFQRRNVCDV